MRFFLFAFAVDGDVEEAASRSSRQRLKQCSAVWLNLLTKAKRVSADQAKRGCIPCCTASLVVARSSRLLLQHRRLLRRRRRKSVSGLLRTTMTPRRGAQVLCPQHLGITSLLLSLKTVGRTQKGLKAFNWGAMWVTGLAQPP